MSNLKEYITVAGYDDKFINEILPHVECIMNGFSESKLTHRQAVAVLNCVQAALEDIVISLTGL